MIIQKEKLLDRKTRSEDGVWTDGNSGMKAEGTQYCRRRPKKVDFQQM